MRFFIRQKIIKNRGQSTVEAAFMIPVLFCLLLIMLQPGIVLYDRIIMNSAATEACRLLETNDSQSEKLVDDYVRRRLSAIPEIDIFHIHRGNCSYVIEIFGSKNNQEVTISIKNELKPLPLIDIGLNVMKCLNANKNIEIAISSTKKNKADWDN